MDLKFYGYLINAKDNSEYYIVRAFSVEHTKVVVSEFMKSEGTELEPSDILDCEIIEIPKEDWWEIFIEYRYIEDRMEEISLEELHEEYENSGLDVYGVISDTFILWQ